MKLTAYIPAIVAIFYISCSKSTDPNEEEKVSILSITPSSGPAGTRVVIKAHFGVDPSDNILCRSTPLLVFLLAFVLWLHQQLKLGINPSHE